MKQLIILNRDLSVKKLLTIDDVIPVKDIVSPQKTTFEIVKDESINISDFVIIKSGKVTEYLGIIEDVTSDITTKIATYPLIHITDNDFILESLNGSIFNWIKKTFTENFVNSIDILTNIPFEFVDNSFDSVLTLPLENGNLFDVLLDIFLKTGVYVDFSLKYAGRKISAILCDVKKADDANKISLRYDNPLITKKPTIEFSQAQSVNKIVFVPAEGVSGITKEFYLLDNNTVTEDPTDKRRIKGVQQKVITYDSNTQYSDFFKIADNELLGDAYSHQITIIIAHNDKFKFDLYDRVQYIDKSKIYNTYCTRIENYNNKYYKVVLGVLRNSLTDKIKSLQKTTSSTSVSSSGGGSAVTVVDSLTSESPTKALSANQGRILKGYTDNAITQVIVNDETGVFTFTRQNGTSFSVDTLLEKVVVNFTYNETTQELELTLEDGTVKKIPMTAFIDDYFGTDGDIITIDVSNDNKISATIKNGSIGIDKLNSDLENVYVTKKNVNQTILGEKTFSKVIADALYTSNIKDNINEIGNKDLLSAYIGKYVLGNTGNDLEFLSKNRAKFRSLGENDDGSYHEIAYLDDIKKQRIRLSDDAGETTRYYLLARLPSRVETDNNASLLISGRIGYLPANINCLISNKNSVSIIGETYVGNNDVISNIFNIVDIVVTNGNINTNLVYIKCNGKFAFDLDVNLFVGEMLGSSAEILYGGNYVTNIDNIVGSFSSTAIRFDFDKYNIKFFNGKNYVTFAKMSDIPNKLPNPQKLVINQGNTPVQYYDGSKEINIDIAGSGNVPSNMVSTDGRQEITGQKTFTGGLAVKNGLFDLSWGGLIIYDDKSVIINSGDYTRKVIINGQMESNVEDGTAPFIVNSKIKVTNLNADTLDGHNSTTTFDGTKSTLPTCKAIDTYLKAGYVDLSTQQEIPAGKLFTKKLNSSEALIGVVSTNHEASILYRNNRGNDIIVGVGCGGTAYKDSFSIWDYAVNRVIAHFNANGGYINGKEIYTVVSHTYPEGWNNYNAYIRFGNGDLICYGWIQGNNTNWSQGTATFAQPFAGTYSFTATPVLVNSGNAFIGTGEYNRQAGSCSVASYGNSTNDKISGWYYVAIGSFGG